MDYQDVLANVGAASAHPGGYESTEFWMNQLSLQPSAKVLDVGCGTGRTALEMNKRFGCDVTGLDIRPAMLKKARKRAEMSGQRITWRLGSAERMPFADNQFNLVVGESVNVFTDAKKSTREAYRVLAPRGTYVNVEMFLLAPVDSGWFKELRRVYGVVKLPDLAGWKALYQRAGFNEVAVASSRPVRPELVFQQQNPYQNDDLTSPQAFQNPAVVNVLSANSKWLEENSRFIGYSIFVCKKSPEGPE